MTLCNSKAGEKAQWLRALIALAEDLGSIPSTHPWQITTICNSSFKESANLIWAL